MSVYKKLVFASTDKTVTVPLMERGGSGKFSVYARRMTGSGTATVAVLGSFKSAPTSNDQFSIKTATSVPNDAIVQVTSAKDSEFPFLVIVYDATGTLTAEVYLVAY